MGMPSSYMFCRLHDMRSAFYDESGIFKASGILSYGMTRVLDSFVAKYPGFSKNDAVMALRHFLISSETDERLVTYQKYADIYGEDSPEPAMEAILGQKEELNKLLAQNPSDPTAIFVIAFCLGTVGRNSPERMTRAFELLNRVLDMEEQGTIDTGGAMDGEVDVIWELLAAYVSFEDTHDKLYGSPIIGNSPYHGKDKNGNPVKQENNNNSSSSSSMQNNSSGGCYVATAVYGSYDCPQVWTLRRYRDYDLAEHWYGRAFIRVYYTISPTIVRCFGASKWFKKICRKNWM